MPEKEFIIWLSDVDWIHVYIDIKTGSVRRYVVKYLVRIADKEYEVARFDSGHDYVHMDVLKPDETKERVIRYEWIGHEECVSFAVNNFKTNYQMYRERFEQWLNKL